MMILSIIGNTIVTILKWIAIAALNILKFGLEVIKIVLMLFGLVARIFLGFVRASTV